MLSRRMFPLRNERADSERRQRADDGVPRPRDVSGKTYGEDDGDSDRHPRQRRTRTAAFRAAEQENAEDRAVDEGGDAEGRAERRLALVPQRERDEDLHDTGDDRDDVRNAQVVAIGFFFAEWFVEIGDECG